MRRRSEHSQLPGDISGYRTLVTNPDGTQPGETQDGRYPVQALPSPPWGRSKPAPKQEYNVPGPSGTGPGGKSLHKDRVRTRSTPGEDSPVPNPEPRITPKRRDFQGAGMWFRRDPVPHDPGQWYGRAESKPGEDINDDPVPSDGQGPTDITIPNNPLVTPYPGEGRFGMRLAVRISEIRKKCGPDLIQRSKGLGVKLRRVDAKNQIWLFDVQGSKGPYRVRVKAAAPGNVTSVKKANVYIACSCPFWRWQGPEHWAKSQGYLYGRAVGSASKPNIKDPSHSHGACKHVLAVLQHITEHKWTLPGRQQRRGSDLQYLADKVAVGELWAIAHWEPDPMMLRVARRYRRRVLRRRF